MNRQIPNPKSQIPVSPEAGFTLLELIVASGIFAAVMLVGLAVISSSSNVESYTRAQREAGQTGRFTTEAIARDIRSANGLFSLTDPGTNTAPAFQILAGGQDSGGEWTGPVLQTNTTLVSNAGQITTQIHRYRVNQDGNHRFVEMQVCGNGDSNCQTVVQTVRITPETIEVDSLAFYSLLPTADLNHRQPYIRLKLALHTRPTDQRSTNVASQSIETVVTARNYHF